MTWWGWAVGITAVVVCLDNASACTRQGPGWYLGGDVAHEWIVRPGEVCTHDLVLNSGADAITSVTIVQKAKIGVVGTRGPTSYAYRAPSSPGADSFAVRIAGTRHGRSSATRISVNVVIRP